jgi:hypothetical protein
VIRASDPSTVHPLTSDIGLGGAIIWVGPIHDGANVAQCTAVLSAVDALQGRLSISGDVDKILTG